MKCEDFYLKYVNWALHIGVEPMSREEYDKAVNKLIPDLGPVNVDAVLRGKKRD
jgi:hypothetical protein